MSIIQEALKKIDVPDKKPVEDHKEKPATEPAAVRKPGPEPGVPGPKYVYYVITALLLIILAGIVVKVSGSSSPSPSAPAALPKKIEPLLPKIERREELSPVRRRGSDLGGFVLNGIMYLVDGPRAIINDIIVGEGETVNGAKVEKIKKDSVLLKYKDSEVDLNINRS